MLIELNYILICYLKGRSCTNLDANNDIGLLVIYGPGVVGLNGKEHKFELHI